MHDLPGALNQAAGYLVRPHEGSDASPPNDLSVEDVLPLDLVSAAAGDRQLTEAEKRRVEEFKAARGGTFHSDLLYAITHQHFAPEAAAELWNRILKHKYEMSAAMRRNIRIAVAALDYRSNLTGELTAAKLISEARIAEIVRLAQRDGLTGLYNHTCCYQLLDMELMRHARCGAPVSVMMIDIDDFKSVNDRHGHQEGDRVLAETGKTIAETTRGSDVCCRYGGEEFAVILPATGAQEAGRLAERLRSGVEQARPGGRAVTVSIGVSSCGPEACSAQELVRRADAALYRAKAEGKNRVAVGT